MVEASGRTDQSGSSFADYFNGTDMGGPNPGAIAYPAVAGNSAANRLAQLQSLRLSRCKDAFQLLLSWIDPNDPLHRNLQNAHFQDGYAALRPNIWVSPTEGY